jgi:hypothetical protein
MCFTYKNMFLKRFMARTRGADCECRCYSMGVLKLCSGRVRKKNQKLRRTRVYLPIRGNSWRLITMVAVGVPGRGSSRLLRLAAMVLGAIRIRCGDLALSAERG